MQDADDGRVLMLGWQDAEAIAATIATGQAHFHSRSRGTLWKKGETSGNTLAIVSLELDCDADAVLDHGAPGGSHLPHRGPLLLRPRTGPGGAGACGAGRYLRGLRDDAVERGADADRTFTEAGLSPGWSGCGRPSTTCRTRPAGSYTSRLLDGGVDATARKVAEEAAEVVMAAKDDAAAERLDGERPRG